MMKVFLKDLRFQGEHGLYREEALAGGSFSVDVEAYYEPFQLPVVNLDNSIDYTVLYEIVSRIMKKETLLLETLATEMAGEMMNRYNEMAEVTITITKLHPPIVQFEGSVGVSFTSKRK